MLRSEDAKRVYDMLIDEGSLRKKSLVFLEEYTKEELEEFGLVTKEMSFVYRLVRIDGLFNYGKEFETSDCYRAALAYQECHRIDHDDVSVNLKLFLYHFYLGQYRSSYKHLQVLRKSEDSKMRSFYLFYVHLLSYFYKNISDEDMEAMLSLTAKELIDIGSEDEIVRTNRVRLLAFEQQFYAAREFLGDIREDEPFSVLSMTKRMFGKIIEHMRETEEEMHRAIERGKVSYLFKLLKAEEMHKMSDEHLIYSMLAKDILKMEIEGVLPSMVQGEAHTLFEAVSMRNYELAKDLCLESVPRSESIMNLLDKAIKMRERCLNKSEKAKRLAFEANGSNA